VKHRPTHVIFDLDGTLMDSSPGILACFRATLSDIGRSASEEELRTLIGPPLRTSFARLGVAEEELNAVVERYRGYYAAEGVTNAALYPWMADTLAMLRAEGIRLAVATAKRVDFARRMLNDHGVAGNFDTIAGASLDLQMTEKYDIMGVAMANWASFDRTTTWMVGDRDYDMVAARQHGVLPVGVNWGFGSEDELRSSGSAAIISAAFDLLTLRLDSREDGAGQYAGRDEVDAQ